MGSEMCIRDSLESSPAGADLMQVDLPAVIERALRETRPLADERFTLTSNIDSMQHILGVESELYSVCINLLTNALRYSPEGGTITISYQDLPDSAGPHTRLTVTDTGVGIAPEHLNRLTERFYRVDLAGSRTRGGTGLGLAIVKHVLRRHHTALQIDSTLGEGSSFYCDFYRDFQTEHPISTVSNSNKNSIYQEDI